MFKLQDVCVLTKLNFGALYKRWTGTLTHKDNLNKCVVITTESGNATLLTVCFGDGYLHPLSIGHRKLLVEVVGTGDSTR